MDTATQTKPVADQTILDHLFRPMGVDGVYARTQAYEDVVDALQRLISRHRPDDAEAFRFPPVMSLRQLEKQGYLNSFPQLLGCICALHGGEADVNAAVERARQGADWTAETTSADLVLSPAACYPIYPIASERGAVPEEGLTFDVAADCFRHEPSKDLDRLQSFRMREFVRIGAPAQIAIFREAWMQRAQAIAESLQLPYHFDRASDPFFGRVGQLMAANQIEQALKFELLIPVRAEGGPTACMSFNYHREHFGKTWGLFDEAGELSHSGCVAFGIDRLTIALFATHGLHVDEWPRGVLEVLRLQ
ncbi:amino acid--[acyl-carrier-protein] ligase [Methylocystis parvus]|uniref:Amino acid--[acyl-carrier-protein] ligase n=1 Tax=Methylocystis parvus TaxID=134 RepID=A0A6B8M3M4_9HYPH|nr:amino acid--[acyl-carrier-protein] ligase [Methylocystis parvus]QGM98494.1 amino acid--[acyl-carrier-protein] ligase [Methylocystis parvus]WBK01167.1 amino acid--[acyl-carrier-protein] ligase [Methylocystis parvus OBBP]